MKANDAKKKAVGKTYTLHGKTYNFSTEEHRLANFLYRCCGLDGTHAFPVSMTEFNCGPPLAAGPEIKKAIARFKEPAYNVLSVDSLFLLDAKDLDELIAPLPMATRAGIKKGRAENAASHT